MTKVMSTLLCLLMPALALAGSGVDQTSTGQAATDQTPNRASQSIPDTSHNSAGVPTSSTASVLLPKQLTFAAAQWCPYSCGDGRGIVSDYLHEIFAQQGIELIVKTIPWSRALQEARFGHIDGVLTLVPGEAQALLMPEVATMHYQDCFYTRPGSDWQFTGVTSLPQQVLGVVQDYSFDGAMDDYIKNNANNPQRLQSMVGSQPSLRLINMLQRGRIDTYLDDKRVMSYSLKQLQQAPNALLNAGCLAEKPLYLGLSPQPAWAHHLLKQLNKALALPANQALLQKIAANYQ